MTTSLLFAAALLTAAAPAGPSAKVGEVQVMRSLQACRGVTADAERLACYDRAAGALSQAEASGDVVVVDREQVRAVRREAFGFHVPTLSLLPHAADRPLDRISAPLASAGRGGDGKWVLTTEEGAQWVQTDSEDLEAPGPHSVLAVRSGALGSYFCKVDRQMAVRCQRRR